MVKGLLAVAPLPDHSPAPTSERVNLMDVISIVEKFRDQETCLRYLESLRFGDRPYCVSCGCDHVRKKSGKDRRWICYECGNSFSVLKDTIYHYSKVPLRKWFAAIALILNAKKSMSSHQLARDVGLSQNGAWCLMTRIRQEMVRELNGVRLEGIVEADETYIGARPRYEPFKVKSSVISKRGRGTTKLAVVGAVARNGEVIARKVDDVSGDTIYDFIKEYVKGSEESRLITDNFTSYSRMSELVEHQIMTRKYGRFEKIEDTVIHTNTIEAFWLLFKRARY